MAATPEALQKQFGIPAQCGTVNLARRHFDFRGANRGDRATYLNTVLPMLVSGAIAAEGQHPASVPGWNVRNGGQGITQAEMARRAGVHRVTVTRRMSKLAAAARGWETAWKRRQKALNLRRSALVQLAIHDEGCPHCAEGLPNCKKKAALQRIASWHIEPMGSRPRPEPTAILTRQRRWGKASRYGVSLPQRRTELAVVEATTGMEIADELGRPSRFLKSETAQAAADQLNQSAAYRGLVEIPGGRYRVQPVELIDVHHHAPSLAEIHQVYSRCRICGKPEEICQAVTAGEMSCDSDVVERAMRGKHAYTPDERATWWEPLTVHDADGVERPNKNSKDGYKEVSECWWDPRIVDPATRRPIPTGARALMSLYELEGLQEEWQPTERFPQGKPKGMLRHLSQAECARRLDCDESSIYRWNCLWERLGVLRIVARGGKDGCQLVLYVPMRQFTDAEAAAEAERMSRAVRELTASQYAEGLWGKHNALRMGLKALELHRGLLAQWQGTERHKKTLYRAFAQACAAAGVLEDFYRRLIPLPPARGGPPDDADPGWFDRPPAA